MAGAFQAGRLEGMGAICGILGRRPAKTGGVDAMLESLSDYGAAGAEWSEDPVSLAQRCRPEAGSGAASEKPASARQLGQARLHRRREAGLVLAADARLDDREALCAALGCRDPGLADGDLILRAYLRWGRGCPNHLLGDYAFAVWDMRERTLFCARDHIGARPFYYAWTAERFVFASAVQAVLAAPGVSGQLDEAVVAAYLTRIGLVTTTHTFFKAVRKLPPGHALTATANRLRIERFWRPENAPLVRPASDAACAEQFLELYARSVRDRLRGPERVGVHVSGGLDSSSIAVLAARELRREGRAAPLAFSWLPTLGDGVDNTQEHALVEAVCRREGLRLFHCGPSADDLLAVLRRDGALPGVHSSFDEEAVQRCAEGLDVRVLLSGWGGDDCASFNGFEGYYEQLLLTGRWLKLAAVLRSRGKGPLKHSAYVALRLVHPSLAREMRRWWRGKAPSRRMWLVSPAFAGRVKPLAETPVREIWPRRTQLLMLQRGHLSERIEGWAASGAGRGIEYRYPLLDRRLLEFALGLPTEQFRRGKWGRFVMRKALSSLLPAEICWSVNKSDPVRIDAMDDAVAEMLPIVRHELAARAAPPSRAGYIDMPRLVESLDAERYRANPKLSPIINALQFLDF